MKTTAEMKLVPIAKLVPCANNARTHSSEQINKFRSSLREFGFINPVIIDRDYGVIAGHGRILAAKEEGIIEVPCVFADHLTEAQKKAYIQSWCGLRPETQLRQIAPLPKGRPKANKTVEDYEKENRRLKMENELLRDFLQSTGRK